MVLGFVCELKGGGVLVWDLNCSSFCLKETKCKEDRVREVIVIVNCLLGLSIFYLFLYSSHVES